MTFCRYCGGGIPSDSVFCAKCGKRLGPRSYPRLSLIVRKLRLRTPYPYFAVLLALYIGWTLEPRQERVDYSHIQWMIEQDRTLDIAEENIFQQALSLVVENTGTVAIADIPIEVSARIDPVKPSEVVAGFLGRKLVILQQGMPLPLVVILADNIEPGAKRRYFLEGSIYAEPPFKVTYEIREEDQDTVLASFVVEQ